MSIPDPFTVTTEIDAIRNTPVAEDGETVEIFSGQGDYLKHGDVTIGLVDIDSATATAWLARYNSHNRNPISSAIAGYSRDMTEGDWIFIGDAIRFATRPDGTVYLADGQNRLKSIEKSGVPQTYIVITGLDSDAQTVMDTGRARTFANTLSLEDDDETGEPWTDVNRLGAIVRRAYVFQMTGRTSRGGGGGQSTPTKPELRKFLSMHSARFRSALAVTQAANTAAPKLGKSGTMIGAAYFTLANKDREAADLFFREMLIKGFGLDDEHPVTHLRRRYGREGVGAIDDDEAFRLTFKTWNHWRKNERITKLQAHQNGWPVDFREYPIV
jgi:hypothetical protein